MCSGMDWNVQFYCERFGGMTLRDAVTLAKERKLVDDAWALISYLSLDWFLFLFFLLFIRALCFL